MYAPNLTDGELVAMIRALATEVATQDHRATSFPCFIVQTKEAVRGVDPELHPDNTHHYVEDGNEVEPEDEAEAARWSEGDYGDREIEECYSTTRWQNAAMFFTQKGADEYVEQHKHNLGPTRVYCSSGHRNTEWQLLCEFLERYGVVPA